MGDFTMIESSSRITTYQTKKNSNETVRLEYEVYMESPIVSIRSYRGNTFTGKGISLHPALMLELLPEIEKAVHEFKAVLMTQCGEQAAEETVRIERKQRRKAAKAAA
jgi:hypothetical protein